MLSALMAQFVGIRPPAPWKPLTMHPPEADSLPTRDADGEPYESDYDPVFPEDPRHVPSAASARQRSEPVASIIGAPQRAAGQVGTPYSQGDSAVMSNAAMSNDPVMIVEDDPEPGRSTQPARQTTRQPRQYAQLFAQLRQG